MIRIRAFRHFLSNEMMLSVIRYPKAVTGIFILLAAIGGYLYTSHLEIITDRKQLIDSELKSNKIYKQYIEEFGDNEIIVLVVAADQDSDTSSVRKAPDGEQRRAMKKVAKAWSAALRKRPQMFPRVFDTIELSEWGNSLALYMPVKDLVQVITIFEKYKTEFENLLKNPSLENTFRILNGLLSVPEDLHEDKQRTGNMITALMSGIAYINKVLSPSTDGRHLSDFSLFSDDLFTGSRWDPEGYLFTKDGLLLTVYCHVSGNSGERNRYERVMRYAQDALRQSLLAVPDSLAISAGIAGMPALEYEELKTTQRDFSRSAVLTLILVTILFIFTFRNFIRPLLAALTLCIAIGITFLAAWLLVGHLNVLALIFTVILVALGIDFAIHFVTHYEAFLSSGKTPVKAIRATRETIGRALLLGGFTTAAAFACAYFTDFIGLAELGLIAGTGLIICLLCMLFLYPSMLYLTDKRKTNFGRYREMRIFSYSNKAKNRRVTIVLLSLFAFLCLTGYLSGQYHFDTNLLAIQARDGDARKWQNILLNSSDRSLFAIALFDDQQELERVRIELENTDVVSATETLFPFKESQKRLRLSPVCRFFRKTDVKESTSIDVISLKRQVWNFRYKIRKFQTVNVEAENALLSLQLELERLYRNLSLPDARKSLTNLQYDFEDKLRDIMFSLESYLCPDSLTITNAPLPLQERYLGSQGQIAMFIYPAENIWEKKNLERFVNEIRKIETNVFGEAVALFENGRSLMMSFLQASGYALFTIFILILLWSRSLKSTFFSVIPLLCSVGLLLGIMNLFDLDWNFANFFGLPVLIGIGVDSGIHLVEAWKKGIKVFSHAAKAVTLSSLTTMIGFGILSTSSHQGVSSLGLILLTGIGLSCLVSLFVLPAILKISKFESNR